MTNPWHKNTLDYAVSEEVHDDTALMRQADWRILPVMFLTYFLQFLDKVSLNVLTVQIQIIDIKRLKGV